MAHGPITCSSPYKCYDMIIYILKCVYWFKLVSQVSDETHGLFRGFNTAVQLNGLSGSVVILWTSFASVLERFLLKLFLRYFMVILGSQITYCYVQVGFVFVVCRASCVNIFLTQEAHGPHRSHEKPVQIGEYIWEKLWFYTLYYWPSSSVEEDF